MAYGITVPFDGVPLSEHRDWYEELVDLGYTDLWSSEADGTDAFTPLTLAAAWTPSLRLGPAIVPSFTRGPARSFDQPFQRTRDMVRFLRAALGGEKVTADYETFSVRGFRLARPPSVVPPILVAALRPGMLRMAGREADGAILNWLSPEDVAKVVPEVGPGKEIAARIFVAPSEDADTVRALGRRLIAAYLNVPVYAAFHEWIGRGPLLEPMWKAWQAGERKEALAAIPDEVVDDLILHGSPAAVRSRVAAYVANGVTTPALAILPFPGVDVRQAIRDLAPTA
jgi:alkanesulfonate monooxygenase SsuD/methylene tetrahydromethanopterin reductase-like flavin-dependent oxidoreductase (luciferase family)